MHPILAALSRRVAAGLAAVAAATSFVVPCEGVDLRLPDLPYGMQVLVDGEPLMEIPARGNVYVEALEGREYSVRLYNRTAERVAVALSVDGMNSIDARTTTAREGAKWILEPWQTLTIDGWQTGADTARRFFFTSESRSYGAWLGKTDDLGVVAAAFFEEQRPRPAPYTFRRERGRDDRGAGAPSAEPQRSSAAEPPPSRQAPESPRAEAEGSLSDDLAATGIGRELDHSVRRIEFDAAEQPVAHLTLRYEYRDTLVRLGVYPRIGDALSRRERARGFTDGDFAPDPYAGR